MLMFNCNWVLVLVYSSGLSKPPPGVGRLIDQSGHEGSEIEACSADHSAQSVEFFSPSFSVIRVGSRDTFEL